MRGITQSNRVRFLNTFIRHEKARSDALFSSLGEGAIITDGQGRISRVNQTAADILGFKAEELEGKWFPGTIAAESLSGKPVPNMNRPIVRTFLTGESISQRLYYVRKDGSKVAVSLSVAPILLRGKPVGAIEVFRDISRELALEHAKDEFISIASHQLRTPATGVKQYIGMVLEGFAGTVTREQKILLKKAYESNERQLKIIDDLLKVARVDAGHLTLSVKKVDLIALLQDVIYEQLGKIEKRRQSLRFIHQPKTLKLHIDAARMRMVFENVIDNASKYTPPHKTILLQVEKKKAWVVVHITDEGVGISPADQRRVFQRFTRLDGTTTFQEVEGSGLGLYWAQKIANLHHGKIRVKSTLGKGSTFEIRLPLK